MEAPKNGKRRQSSNGSSKRSAGADSGTLVIRTRASDPLVDPILCSFPGGLPAALQNANPEETAIPKFVIKQHQGDSKLIVGKDHACLYSAVATPQTISQERRPTKMVVGIYDKQTKQLILQPTAEQGYVYAMTQSVPSYSSAKEKDGSETISAADRRKALFEDFGSAKKRKVLRSQEANRVNVDSVVGAGNVSAMLQNMSESNRQAVEEEQQQQQRGAGGDAASQRITKAVHVATQEWRRDFLPAYNEQAEEPSAVYSAQNIAGPAVWVHLTNVISKCLTKENLLKAIVEGPPSRESGEGGAAMSQNRRKELWYPSVLRILGLVVPKGEAAKKQLMCAVLLNYYLILYVKLHFKKHIEGVSSDGYPRYFGVPREVGERWLESFTTQVANSRDERMGHIMSRANKDRCHVHMFLLALMAEGGDRMRSENIQPLANELKMDVKDAAHLLRLAGCSVVRKNATQTTAALKTPLTFPSIKRGGRAR